MHRLLAALLGLACTLACAPPAAAYDATDLRTTLAREMARASPSSGLYVRDLGSGRELYALRANTARVPASVEKLYTTATALLRLGPEATLDTRVLSDGVLDADGVLRGDLVLVGAGDPFFGTEAATRLAEAVQTAGVRRIDGAVLGDETGFDRLRSGCCSGYDPDLGGVLSALAYNRGFLGNVLRLDAPRFAATRFAEQLRAIGIRSSGSPAAGTAPEAAGVIATEPSMPVRELIRFVNVPSNNFAAEMLLKALGDRFGTAGSTRAGAAIVRSTLREIDVRPRLIDGSGLSRSNRTTPRDVVKLLDRMDKPDIDGIFRTSLALAGLTGTVKNRMRKTAAYRRCRVKTGTLRRVSALAGICRTRGGQDVAFAVLMNRVSSFFAARAIQDRIAAAIARLDTVAAIGPLPSGGAGAP
jgi:D-alanyl-D-alanine carboxypeptidase/D-alanyl-D-alanine-endopeptidase (penicillin-binding protein 4)